MNNRIEKMVKMWNAHKVAFSHISYMEQDNEFFNIIGHAERVATTSQTGTDVIYYCPLTHEDGKRAMQSAR